MNYLLDGQGSERLLFRKLELQDFPQWLDFFRDPEAIRFWNYPDPDPELLCRRWFDKTFDRYEKGTGGMNVLVDKVSGTIVGQAGLCIQWVDDVEELEIGYSILPFYWRKGFATEAAIRCRDFAFDRGFRDSLISIIHQDNIGSQRVARNAGMHAEKNLIYSENPVIIFRISRETTGSPK